MSVLRLVWDIPVFRTLFIYLQLNRILHMYVLYEYEYPYLRAMLDPMLLVGNAMQMRVEGELDFFLFLIPLQKQLLYLQSVVNAVLLLQYTNNNNNNIIMNKTIDYLGVHRHSLLIALNSPQPTLATNKEQQQLASTQYNTTQHNTTQHNTTHNTMTAPTDAQWAATSKLLQSMIQRSDTGTYAMHHNSIVCVVRSETNTGTKRNETNGSGACYAVVWSSYVSSTTTSVFGTVVLGDRSVDPICRSIILSLVGTPLLIIILLLRFFSIVSFLFAFPFDTLLSLYR